MDAAAVEHPAQSSMDASSRGDDARRTATDRPG